MLQHGSSGASVSGLWLQDSISLPDPYRASFSDNGQLRSLNQSGNKTRGEAALVAHQFQNGINQQSKPNSQEFANSAATDIDKRLVFLSSPPSRDMRRGAPSAYAFSEVFTTEEGPAVPPVGQTAQPENNIQTVEVRNTGEFAKVVQERAQKRLHRLIELGQFIENGTQGLSPLSNSAELGIKKQQELTSGNRFDSSGETKRGVVPLRAVDHSAAEVQVESIQAELATLRAQLKRERALKDRVTERLSHFEAVNTELERRLVATADENRILTEEIEVVTEKAIETLRRGKAFADSQAEEALLLRNKCAETEILISKIQTQAAQDAERWAQEVEYAQRDALRLAEEAEQLTRSKSIIDRDLKSLTDTAKQLSEENNSLRSALAGAEREINALRSEQTHQRTMETAQRESGSGSNKKRSRDNSAIEKAESAQPNYFMLDIGADVNAPQHAIFIASGFQDRGFLSQISSLPGCFEAGIENSSGASTISARAPSFIPAGSPSLIALPSTVTHLVTNGSLTIKLLLALVRGNITIVGRCFIDACVKSGALLTSEEALREGCCVYKYVLRENGAMRAPHLSKVPFADKDGDSSNVFFPPLYRMRIAFTQRFASGKHAATVCQLAEAGGASIVDHPEESNLLICFTSEYDALEAELPEKLRKVLCTWEQVVDCLIPKDIVARLAEESIERNNIKTDRV